MNLAKLAIATLALSAAPAFAAGEVAVGATVYGPEGNPVGQIVSVEAGQAVVDTGKHKVPLNLDAYGKSDKGPTITVSKVQLDTMMDDQLAALTAKRDAALIPGAAVKTADGAALGAIATIEGNNIIINRGGDATKKVTLLREHFDALDTGLTARLTLAQIDAALNGQANSE